ncbi:response regulator [Novosphingobium sp. G106]|uniref:response regulator n=1 Tax=Novosphingobium sp. G106 TaxID=2849500 RepID=UPI001C2D9D7F|nr:response regulator [Novosphingobium sp. G106]MBV1688449.1 response regulator [Novosphingobium sp. G106]
MLVDDDERNLLALSHVLQDTAEVVTAASGKDALRLLLTQDFAVILLDVFMPGMDGYEVASLIRERQQTARIPIIFLSAVNKETEHLMRGYAMGAVDYVFKPVDPIVLRSKVGVFVDLYEMRLQIEEKSRDEQELRDAHYRAQLEKLQIQRELDESRIRQAAIISSLPIILYLEPENCTPRVPQFVGGNFDAVTGFPFAEVEANPTLWADRLHPEDSERALLALEERKLTGAMSIEYRWQCAKGEYKHFLDQAVLLPGGEGRQPEYAGTLIDVSERKQLEAKLLQAGKLDAIGQLTGGIAHDFNNLLATILGGINILQRRMTFPEKEQSVLDHMRHASENGAALVRRMMAFARKQDLHPTCVAPASLRQSVLGLVEHTLGGTIDIEWDHADTSLNLFVDESQLELALVNLIINARDAMPDGGRIIIRFDELEPTELASQGLSGKSYVRVLLEDEGEGIPGDLIDRIVEPFFTTKEIGKGTGLGLSMVAGFAQQSGGKLAIRSEVGKGTAIELILPADAKPAAMRETGNVIPMGKMARRSILLVDDDDAVREILGGQLEELNLDVVSAASGLRALELLAEPGRCIDVLLTDFAMPGINGSETILRARALRPSLQTILMTGYADDRLVPHNDSDIPVIRKPIDLLVLQQALQDPAANLRREV